MIYFVNDFDKIEFLRFDRKISQIRIDFDYNMSPLYENIVQNQVLLILLTKKIINHNLIFIIWNLGLQPKHCTAQLDNRM